MSHLHLLTDWFARLSDDTFLALPPDRERLAAMDGHDEAADLIFDRDLDEDTSYVFWHEQSDAFTRDGTLGGELFLHWGGDHDVVAERLADPPAGLEVVDNGPGQAFVVRVAGAPDAPPPELTASDPKARFRAWRALSRAEQTDAVGVLLPTWEETLKKGAPRNELFSATSDLIAVLFDAGHPERERVLARAVKNRNKDVRGGALAALDRLEPAAEHLALLTPPLADEFEYVTYFRLRAAIRGTDPFAEALEHLDALAEHLPDYAVFTTMRRAWAAAQGRRRDDGGAASSLDWAADASLPATLRQLAFENAVMRLTAADAPVELRARAVAVARETGLTAPSYAAALGDWAGGATDGFPDPAAQPDRARERIAELGTRRDPDIWAWLERCAQADDPALRAAAIYPLLIRYRQQERGIELMLPAWRETLEAVADPWILADTLVETMFEAQHPRREEIRQACLAHPNPQIQRAGAKERR